MTQESTTSTDGVQDAVVLAAGNGDRFRHRSRRSKLLTSIAGTPLLIRTLTAAQQAGITTVHLVVGYDAEHVAELASSAAPRGLHVHAHLNREWRLENGVSVLAVRHCLHRRPFALLMGDHLFDVQALQRLRSAPRQPGETLLCVDAAPCRSRLRKRGRASACARDDHRNRQGPRALRRARHGPVRLRSRSVFDAIEASCRSGDTTLSGGIRQLTAAGAVRGVDIGDARWCDVDTLEDVPQAEQVAAPMCPA